MLIIIIRIFLNKTSTIFKKTLQITHFLINQKEIAMPDTIKVDTRGMSCSQASFQAKCAAINNTELDTIIEVLVSGHSSCESVIRGCKKYGYEGTFKNTENEDILVTLTKVK